MNYNKRRQALAIARQRADRLHQQMHTPFDRPVDVFGLTQKLGLWLAAQPMDHTYGFYLSEGSAAGVVVNSQHPEALQRFTCAHELGHHLLGHGSHTDDSNTVERTADLALREQQAQVFAAALLMPPPLINRTLRQLNIAQSPTPSEIYAVGRDMAVSYIAALHGLASLKKIDPATVSALAKRGPKAAKDQLREGPPLTDARADLWVVHPNQSPTVIFCRLGDEIHIRLPEDLSTGYIWDIEGLPTQAHNLDSSGPQLHWDGGATLREHLDAPMPRPADTLTAVSLLSDTHASTRPSPVPLHREGSLFEPGLLLDESDDLDDLAIPAPGVRRIVLSPAAIGRHEITLVLRPAWSPDALIADRQHMLLDVGPRKILPEQGGFAPQQNAVRVRELAAA
ncbi:ImmA/IrrE family metallo-endopeptidase [Nocardia takedensis]